MNIKSLPEKWRDNRSESSVHGHRYDCANDLEAALPIWTCITDNPDTWPEQGQDILYSIGEGWLEVGEWNVRPEKIDKYIDNYWRPFCDLDYPPEDIE